MSYRESEERRAALIELDSPLDRLSSSIESSEKNVVEELPGFVDKAVKDGFSEQEARELLRDILSVSPPVVIDLGKSIEEIIAETSERSRQATSTSHE
jgi:hypothetical protein